MPTFNENENKWEDVPNRTTIVEGWTVLVLDNGNKILTFGDYAQAGAQVHVLTPENQEIVMWDHSEWGIPEEAERVMGAMLRAAGCIKIN